MSGGKSAIMRAVAPLLALAWLASGCAPSELNSHAWKNAVPVPLGAKESLVVVGSREFESSSFVDCVADAVGEDDDDLPLVSAHKFRGAVFGAKPSRSMRRDLPRFLALLPEELGFYHRVQSLNLRYVVLVDAPDTANQDHAFICSTGGALGLDARACGGAGQRSTIARATIIDLKEGRDAGNVMVMVAGEESVGGALLTLPLPFYGYAAIEGQACDDLGSAVASLMNRRV